MLYLVSTPIGNLGDMTQRAIDTLQSVDLVVSEDTRKTGFLLNHFGIKKPQLVFREDNEKKVLPKIMGLLAEGKNIALVTVISLASIAITYFMAQYQIVVGKETDSPALAANGIHARADMYSSIAVMCALVGALMGFSAWTRSRLSSLPSSSW